MSVKLKLKAIIASERLRSGFIPFENANMLILLKRRKLVFKDVLEKLFRQIGSFVKNDHQIPEDLETFRSAATILPAVPH